jgi:tRNA threonylcarbamoyladenosine biosynthesis protein TsaB
MLILAADTSGKFGSIALAACEADGRCEVLDVVPLTGGSFSAQLVPEIASLLARLNFTRQQIEAFAVASGPGSFTGLRVGLAAIKALSEVLNKPVAAVSLLEAIAIAGAGGPIITALDAGRNEVYTGEYEVQSGDAKLVSERLLSNADFTELTRGRIVATPDSTVAEIARTNALEVHQVERPRAGVIAQLGWRKILLGQTVSPEALEANYIRRSDAEIFSQPK